MSKKENKGITRESIIAALRAAVEEEGKQIRMLPFLERTKIGRWHFHRVFSCWNEALRAAGFDFEVRGERVPGERLLTDWGKVVRKIQRVPNAKAYGINGEYCYETFRARFGSYRNVPRVFKKFAKDNPEWADVLAICAKRPRKRDRRSCPLSRRELEERAQRSLKEDRDKDVPREPNYGRVFPGRAVFGDPMLLPGLAAAPVNESGVIHLFGIIGWRLGFHVELLRPFFPDCEALRRVGPGEWQRVTIEFEYESRNFRDHGHDPKACDLIVCWEHNWADCPKNLEVIALKDELQRLAPKLELGSEGLGTRN